MLYENIERLLYANTNQLNDLISILSRMSLKEIFLNFKEKQVLLIYYRLNAQNKNKLFYASIYVREVVNYYEDIHTYFSKVEPALIFVQGTNHKEIVEVLSNPIYQSYTKDYIVIVNKLFQFVGIIYVADIFIAHKLKISLEPNKINYIQSIKYDSNYSIKDSVISNNTLIDIHKIVLTDKNNCVLGLINTDHITKHYDIYQKNKTYQLYIIPRKNLFHFVTIVGANFVGTIISSIITMVENLHMINIVLTMFIRCITDAVVIFLIEDKISKQKLNMYVLYLIILSTAITSLILLLFTKKVSIFIYTIISMLCILSITYFALKNIYKQGSNLRTFITLLIPEIIVMSLLSILNRIICFN